MQPSRHQNGLSQESCYVEAPEGSSISPNDVLLLNKSLYDGLKQASRSCNKKSDSWLRQQDFQPAQGDPSLHVRSGNAYTVISMHADDQLIACNSRAALNRFK